MQQWLQSTFAAGPNGQVIVYEDSGLAVGVDPVAQTGAGGIFASISSAPPSYATLSALPCAAQGWQKIFDAWKAAGHVS